MGKITESQNNNFRDLCLFLSMLILMFLLGSNSGYNTAVYDMRELHNELNQGCEINDLYYGLQLEECQTEYNNLKINCNTTIEIINGCNGFCWENNSTIGWTYVNMTRPHKHNFNITNGGFIDWVCIDGQCEHMLGLINRG